MSSEEESSDSDSVVTNQYVVQAPRDKEVELLLNGLDCVESATIDDAVEQAISIDIFQFLTTIEHAESVNVTSAIEDIKHVTILETEERISSQLTPFCDR
jgi:hypothetical protein